MKNKMLIGTEAQSKEKKYKLNLESKSNVSEDTLQENRHLLKRNMSAVCGGDAGYIIKGVPTKKGIWKASAQTSLFEETNAKGETTYIVKNREIVIPDQVAGRENVNSDAKIALTALGFKHTIGNSFTLMFEKKYKLNLIEDDNVKENRVLSPK